MSRIEHVNQALDGLGCHFDLPGLTLGEQDSVSLTVDGVSVSLRLEEQPIESLWVFVDLGAVDDNGGEVPRRGRLLKLLEEGFNAWVANLMTVGLNPAGDRAHGACCIPVVNLGGEGLAGQVEAMVAAASRLGSR